MRISGILGFVPQSNVNVLEAKNARNAQIEAASNTMSNLNMSNAAVLGRSQVSFGAYLNKDREFSEKLVKMCEELAKSELDEEGKKELLEMMGDKRFHPEAFYMYRDWLNEPKSSTPVLELLFSSNEDTSPFVAKVALHPEFDFNEDYTHGKHKRSHIINDAMYQGKDKELTALLENNPFVEMNFTSSRHDFDEHNNIIDYVRAHSDSRSTSDYPAVIRALEHYQFEGGREKALEKYNRVNGTNAVIEDELRPSVNEVFAYEIRKEKPDAAKLLKLIGDKDFDPNKPCVMSKSARSYATPMQAAFNLKNKDSYVLISTLVVRDDFDPNATSFVVSLRPQEYKTINLIESAVRNNNYHDNRKLGHFLTKAYAAGVQVNVSDVPVTNRKVRSCGNLIEFAEKSGNSEAAKLLQDYAVKTGQIKKAE